MLLWFYMGWTMKSLCMLFFCATILFSSMIVYGCELSFDKCISVLNFSQDGKRLAVGFVDGSVAVVEDGRIVVEQAVIMEHKITAIAIDGDLLIAGSSSGILAVKNLKTNVCNTYSCHNGVITTIKSVGDFVVTGSEDKTVCLLEKKSVGLIKRFDLSSPVTSLEVAGKKNDMLFIGCADGMVFCCLCRQELIRPLFSYPNQGAVTFLRRFDEDFFVGFEKGQIVLFSDQGHCLRMYQSSCSCSALQLSFNGLFLIGVSSDGLTECWWNRVSCDMVKNIVCQQKKAQAVAINDSIIFCGVENKLILKMICPMVKKIKIVNEIARLELEKIEMIDGAGLCAGTIDACIDKNFYSVNVNCSSKTASVGNLIKLFSVVHGKSQAPLVYFLRYPLFAIDKILIFQDLQKGVPMVRFTICSKPGQEECNFLAIPGAQYGQEYFKAAPISVALYSPDVKIIDAKLKFVTEGASEELISGDKIGSGHFVRIFQQDKARSPFTLFVRTEKGCYAWPLESLFGQSELFLTKVAMQQKDMKKGQSAQRERLLLMHVCESTGKSIKYDLSRLNHYYAWRPFFANRVRMKYNIPLTK